MMRRILRGAKCAKPKEPWATCGPSFQRRAEIFKRFLESSWISRFERSPEGDEGCI